MERNQEARVVNKTRDVYPKYELDFCPRGRETSLQLETVFASDTAVEG